MPSLHRKAARARFESAVSATASSAATPDPSQEKLYTNADVSKMVKEAVCNAVSHTKEFYDKILQEKLAGQFLFRTVVIVFLRVTFCRLQNNISNSFVSTKII